MVLFPVSMSYDFYSFLRPLCLVWRSISL